MCVQDALTESIRRQLMVFSAGAAATVDVMPDRLYPIYLDVMIEGLSVGLRRSGRCESMAMSLTPSLVAVREQLRDQFEWDISNSFLAVQSFASTVG